MAKNPSKTPNPSRKRKRSVRRRAQNPSAWATALAAVGGVVVGAFAVHYYFVHHETGTVVVLPPPPTATPMPTIHPRIYGTRVKPPGIVIG